MIANPLNTSAATVLTQRISMVMVDASTFAAHSCICFRWDRDLAWNQLTALPAGMFNALTQMTVLYVRTQTQCTNAMILNDLTMPFTPVLTIMGMATGGDA